MKLEFQKSLIFGLMQLLFLGGMTNSAFSQKSVISNHQQWIQSYHEGKVSEKWTLLLDAGFRWKEGFHANSYIIRAGAGYSILPALRVAAGMAHMGTFVGEKVERHEFRPYQEATTKSNLGNLVLNHRLRVEERFFKNLVVTQSNASFNFRFRYALMLGIPLAKLSATIPERKLVLNLGDEIFINGGKDKPYIFDQNRLILSPTIQWNKSLSLSFTYNYQYAGTPDPNLFTASHVAWIQIRHNLKFSQIGD